MILLGIYTSLDFDIAQNIFLKAVTLRVQTLAFGLAALFFVISLAVNYAKNSFNKQGKNVDIKEIITCVVLMLCISLYIPLANMTYYVSQISYNYIAFDESTNNKLVAQLEQEQVNLKEKYGSDPILQQRCVECEFRMKIKSGDKWALDQKEKDACNTLIEEAKLKAANEKSGEGLFEKITGGVAWLLNAIWALPGLLITETFKLIAHIARVTVGLLIKGYVMVLYAVGPLAFAFSILPIFRKKWEEWIGSYLVMLFSFVTLAIIDHVVWVLQYTLLNNFGILSMLDGLIVSFLIIALYCSPFWITSKYVGSADAGAMVGKALGIMITSVALAASAYMGASAGAGGSGGGVANSLFDAGKNATEKDT